MVTIRFSVYCNQDEEADEIFYKHRGEVLLSLALVPVGDLNLPDVSWKSNTAERKQKVPGVCGR